MTCDDTFLPSHIGTKLLLRNGGEMFISKYVRRTNTQKFLSYVEVEVFKPLSYVSSGRELNSDLVIKNENGTYFLQLSTESKGWKNTSKVGMSVVIPGKPSFLLTEILSSVEAIGVPVVDFSVDDLYVQDNHWFVFNMGAYENYENVTKWPWFLQEKNCHNSIERDASILYQTYKLDIGEKWTFSVTANIWGFDPIPMPINIPIIYTSVLTQGTEMVSSDLQKTFRAENLTVNFTPLKIKKWETALNFYLWSASLLCPKTAVTLTIQVTCPFGKKIKFYYDFEGKLSPHQLEKAYKDSEKFFTLPVNYRPPSKKGIAIPTTENIYNADPSKPKHNNYYEISKNSGTYKQCLGKSSREKCGCTDEKKVSRYAQESDCIEKVYLLKHPAILIPNLTLLHPEFPEVPLSPPYFIYVIEINHREDFTVTSTATPSLIRLRKNQKIPNHKILQDPSSLVITMKFCFTSRALVCTTSEC
ncbi:cation channel sperm-associated protein subunit beta-like isoform X4 [Limulus polyphemus]|uniref:Cation channel sperm-associated protein subunit beta-like isoform X4 n=1 Tax=Limulus polyphemus TaxID=6850 RepID=A0ABM1SJ39_LIMPO|nr:cation channel sperm-associated protein subunit beta-like isoform X4 [Limulus polyphemus]